MAFFDFLTQPLGGYTGGQAGMQGPTQTGQSLGTPQGPTWGNILQAALAQSQSPTTKGLASLIPNQPGQTPLFQLPKSSLPDANDPTKGGTGNAILGLATNFLGGLL